MIIWGDIPIIDNDKFYLISSPLSSGKRDFGEIPRPTVPIPGLDKDQNEPLMVLLADFCISS